MQISPRPRHYFTHDGIKFAYCDEGEGVPIILVHGFSSNIDFNWGYTGWFDTLLKAGFRVIALDNRGHGFSEKIYEKDLYSLELMAHDVKALADHLGLKRFNIMGFSMGARITSYVCAYYPNYVIKAVIAGMGKRLIQGVGTGDEIAEGLEAPTLADVKTPRGKMFRLFAEQTKSDLKALAACVRGSRNQLSAEQLATLTMPMLVIVGTEDDIAGKAQPLADLLPNARAIDLQGKNHMNSVGDKQYKAEAVTFFGGN